MKCGVTLRCGLLCLTPLIASMAFAQAAVGTAQAAASTVYRCPGKPVLYTDSISAKEAKDRGCTVLDNVPITVIQSTKPRPAAQVAAVASGAPPVVRIDPAEQRARDSDARRILEAELRREEERLASMKAEFNHGEPERRGDEKNYQKYQERVADMKAALARKESDIVALKREISKQPQ